MKLSPEEFFLPASPSEHSARHQQSPHREALFLGRETAYGKILPGLHQDCFELAAELIEVKNKPSYPIGIMGMDSFGRVPEIKDRGLMKRGILAIGKQDAALEDLTPLDENVLIRRLERPFACTTKRGLQTRGHAPLRQLSGFADHDFEVCKGISE